MCIFPQSPCLAICGAFGLWSHLFQFCHFKIIFRNCEYFPVIRQKKLFHFSFNWCCHLCLTKPIASYSRWNVWKMKSRKASLKNNEPGFAIFLKLVTRRERIDDWQSNQDNRGETKQNKIEVAVKLYRDVTYERRDGNYQKSYKKKLME